MKAMCFVARERLQKKLKFLELLTFFPRAELIANMNINFQKIFVIQMNFLTLKGGKYRMALRSRSFIYITKLKDQLRANFELDIKLRRVNLLSK